MEKKGVVKLFKSKTGGIGAIIAMVVSIILVLGLISYAVMNQVAGAKSTGDKAAKDQQRVAALIDDGNTVTGDIVKDYRNRYSGTGTAVAVLRSDGLTGITDANIVASALFSMSQTYNVDGQIATIVFKQKDLNK